MVMKEEVIIPISTVISDLVTLFETKTQTEFGTTESDGKFMIDKRHFSRMEVISMLTEYFDVRRIEGGYLTLDPITMVLTTFEVTEGIPPQLR